MLHSFLLEFMVITTDLKFLERPRPGPGPLRDSTEDRRIGLNMNYSIIFTEISFSPETPNNSYDNWDYARIRQKKGGQSVSPGSKAANTMLLPQIKIRQTRVTLGTS